MKHTGRACSVSRDAEVTRKGQALLTWVERQGYPEAHDSSIGGTDSPPCRDRCPPPGAFQPLLREGRGSRDLSGSMDSLGCVILCGGAVPWGRDSAAPPHCDNQKCLQMLSGVPWGQNRPGENPCFELIRRSVVPKMLCDAVLPKPLKRLSNSLQSKGCIFIQNSWAECPRKGERHRQVLWEELPGSHGRTQP